MKDTGRREWVARFRQIRSTTSNIANETRLSIISHLIRFPAD